MFKFAHNYGCSIHVFRGLDSRFNCVIFGGLALIEKSKAKICGNDIKVLDLDSLTLKELHIQGDIVPGRKHAASSVFDSRYFLVSGGQDNHIDMHGDFYTFDLLHHTWTLC